MSNIKDILIDISSILTMIFSAIFVFMLLVGSFVYTQTGYKGSYNICEETQKDIDRTRLERVFKYHTLFGCWLAEKK